MEPSFTDIGAQENGISLASNPSGATKTTTLKKLLIGGTTVVIAGIVLILALTTSQSSAGLASSQMMSVFNELEHGLKVQLEFSNSLAFNGQKQSITAFVVPPKTKSSPEEDLYNTNMFTTYTQDAETFAFNYIDNRLHYSFVKKADWTLGDTPERLNVTITDQVAVDPSTLTTEEEEAAYYESYADLEDYVRREDAVIVEPATGLEKTVAAVVEHIKSTGNAVIFEINAEEITYAAKSCFRASEMPPLHLLPASLDTAELLSSEEAEAFPCKDGEQPLKFDWSDKTFMFCLSLTNKDNGLPVDHIYTENMVLSVNQMTSADKEEYESLAKATLVAGLVEACDKFDKETIGGYAANVTNEAIARKLANVDHEHDPLALKRDQLQFAIHSNGSDYEQRKLKALEDPSFERKLADVTPEILRSSVIQRIAHQADEHRANNDIDAPRMKRKLILQQEFKADGNLYTKATPTELNSLYHICPPNSGFQVAPSVAGETMLPIRRLASNATAIGDESSRKLMTADQFFNQNTAGKLVDVKFPCVYIHGSGVSAYSPTLVSQYPEYWGNVLHNNPNEPCYCSKKLFVMLDTMNHAPTSAALANELMHRLLQVNGASTYYLLQNMVIFTHGTGKMMLKTAMRYHHLRFGPFVNWMSVFGTDANNGNQWADSQTVNCVDYDGDWISPFQSVYNGAFGPTYAEDIKRADRIFLKHSAPTSRFDTSKFPDHRFYYTTKPGYQGQFVHVPHTQKLTDKKTMAIMNTWTPSNIVSYTSWWWRDTIEAKNTQERWDYINQMKSWYGKANFLQNNLQHYLVCAPGKLSAPPAHCIAEYFMGGEASANALINGRRLTITNAELNRINEEKANAGSYWFWSWDRNEWQWHAPVGQACGRDYLGNPSFDREANDQGEQAVNFNCAHDGKMCAYKCKQRVAGGLWSHLTHSQFYSANLNNADMKNGDSSWDDTKSVHKWSNRLKLSKLY